MTLHLFTRWPGATKAAGVAFAACLSIAGCGGGGGAGPPLAATFPGVPAATGDGAATAQVPVAVSLAPGNCAASCPGAQPSPVPNSKLDCAP